MPDIQFEITTDLTPYTGANIQTNKEAVKAYLADLTAPYKAMVITEDGIPAAKKDLANLRKIIAGIEEQRKAVKAVWMAPYNSYDADCKEIQADVNAAIANLDGQIKDFDRRRKEEKKQRLLDLFNDNSADISDYISFEDVFDSKWLNATFSEIDAANSIVQQIEDVRDGLETIRSLESDYEAAMLNEYGKSHNLSKALAEGKRLEAIQKAEEERRAALEAEDNAPTPKAEETPYTPPVMPITPSVKPIVEKTYDKTFHFPELTKSQMYALKACFDANNIKYEII